MLSIRVPDIKILNEPFKERQCAKPALDVSKDLQRFMLRLRSEDGKAVDYVQLKKSPLFSQYEQQARDISNIDLTTLNEEEKCAFFISILSNITKSFVQKEVFWKGTLYFVCFIQSQKNLQSWHPGQVHSTFWLVTCPD